MRSEREVKHDWMYDDNAKKVREKIDFKEELNGINLTLPFYKKLLLTWGKSIESRTLERVRKYCYHEAYCPQKGLELYTIKIYGIKCSCGLSEILSEMEGKMNRKEEIEQLKDSPLQSAYWHKAGWDDGVAHERKRSEILVEALKKIGNHIYDDQGVDANFICKTITDGLQAYEREDIPEENKRMGCNHKGPICEA